MPFKFHRINVSPIKMCCVPQSPLYCLHINYQTYSIVLTVPLKVTTVPPSGETVKVAVGAKYWISCVVTGDETPATNQWLHSDKMVETDTDAGITVSNITLPNSKRINSTITFTHVTEDQLGVYICSAGDGKPNATVTLKKAGKWNV